MKKFYYLTISILILTNLQAQKKYQYPFQDPSLPIETRVNDLVSRLTLEEKVAQMLNATPAIPRLGIPAYDWWNECLHGVARTKFKTTSYPQAIGMAATFDVDAMKTMGDYTSEEGRAIFNASKSDTSSRRRYIGLTYWTPNINIFRDPRWGRGQETYGEDPFLTASIAKAFVSGLQGNDPKYLKAAGCAKHYAIHSGPEPSRHAFDVNVSDHDLWDTYLPAFHELVVNAKVAGVMCAYNAYAGQPCCGSDKLMMKILRDEWKFRGYVTSDCGAIDDFFNFHKTHPDAEAASVDAVRHGTDIDCGNVSYKTLVKAVKDGQITEKELDVSLIRLFTIRYRLGMFDPDSMVKFSKITTDALEAKPHKDHALRMARESIVLLRNQNNLLPLKKTFKKIAVLGPNADNANTQLGNYNGQPSVVTTVLQGIKDKAGNNAEIFYSKATNLVDSSFPDFSKLIDSIKDFDLLIYVGGISPRVEGEEMRVTQQGFKGGDRTTINLPVIQTEFLKALKATGKPVVFVMMTGSAIAIPWESENIPAILNAWYGGQAAGTAVADILFGDYNPSGRLPVTFYKSDDDLPAFEDYSMANRTYRYFKGVPLYPFGFGLSFSKIEYSNLRLTQTTKVRRNNLSVTVTVTNKSNIQADEVVQVYLNHPDAPYSPQFALKAFRRISLGPNASQSVSFTLFDDQLKIIDQDGRSKFLPGRVNVYVGGSSPGRRSEQLGAAKAVDSRIMLKEFQ